MRDASQKRKELEKEHAETLASLREKQNELQWRCSGIAEKAKLRENIESLQSKVRELEKKMELQNVHHEELLLEMASIKRSSLQRSNTFVATTASSYTTPNQLWKTTNVSSNQEVQTSPESYTAADKTYPPPNQRIITSSSSSGATVSFDPNIYTKHKQPLNTEIRQPPNISGCCGGIAPTSSYIDLHRASLDPSSHHYPISTSSSGSRYFDSTIKQHHLYTPVAKPSTATLVSVVPSSSIAVQTDSILVNKMNTEKPPCPDDKGCMMMMHPSQPHQHSNLAVEIDKIMAKISRDNKVLAELDRTHANTGVHGPISGHEITRHTDGSVVVGNSVHLAGTASQVNVAKPSSLVSYHQPTQTAFDIGTRTSYIPTHACQLPTISSNQQPYTVPSSYHFSFPPSSMPPTLPATSHYDVNSAYNALMSSSNRHENIPIGSYLNCREVMNRSTDSDLDRIHDMVEIPGKGLCYVYIAKYSYDPFSRSTGSCPEAELAVNAGDYLLVWGASEDEGYVDAELMDGRRGLVPINYIQRLSGEELSDFNQRVLAGMKEIDDCLSTVIPQDIECIPTEDYSKRYGLEYHLGDIMEEEEDDNDTAENVPAPKQLTLERQLNKSIVIRWNAPDNNNASHCIDSYHVYVDKMLKATVKATERTKALLEGVDSNKPHRISVRSVTHNRRTSRDAACTMLIGKDVPAYPTNVRATHVTATSAVISWLPSNSNYQHTVCVNNVEVRTVKPGVYRHTITGLVPNTTYRVTVRAKNIRAPQYDDKSSISDKFASHIDFHTLPKGLPDPPAEIQVEPGPQDGTLLVTWIPVTLNNSNGALITGYAVYADGKKVTEVDSPTGDHALIDISKIMSLNPKHVTVRTKSKENHSADSAPIPIPSSVMSRSRHAHQHSSKHVQKAVPRSGHQMPRHPPRNAYGQVIIEPEENLSDKEIYPGQNPDVPAIEITKDSNVEALYSGDDTLDSNGRGGRGMASYNQRMPMKSNIPPKSHAERGRPPPPQIIQQERGLSRMNYDMRDDKNMDMHRERRMMASDSQHHFSYDNESKGPHRSQSPDRKGRWVQALFDYDPTTMSPNPNACLEELPFLAGDFIKIYGDQDPDGFYWGECHGKRGFVPHNMISAVTTPKHLLEDIKKREKLDVYHDMITKKMVAMFDYDPKQNSPNTDTDVEINFKQGQIVTVYGEPDEDGFYIGEVDGVRGLVPSNYLQEVGELSTEDAINNYLYGGNARGTVAKHVPSQYDRGHGPGAKGPPPPPRDGLAPRDPRDKRKGSSNDQETTGERKTTTSSRSHNW